MASYVFHIVFALVSIWGIVVFLSLEKKYSQIRQHLVPLLLCQDFEFPSDRSLLVRGIVCLQRELSLTLNKTVRIEYHFFETLNRERFLMPLANLLYPTVGPSPKVFLLEANHDPLCAADLCAQLSQMPQAHTIYFSHSGKSHDKIWMVRMESQ